MGTENSQDTDDLSQFVYPDVFSFMCNLKKEEVTFNLLTYGSHGVQEIKLRRTGLEAYFTNLFYVEQGSKAAAITERST